MIFCMQLFLKLITHYYSLLYISYVFNFILCGNKLDRENDNNQIFKKSVQIKINIINLNLGMFIEWIMFIFVSAAESKEEWKNFQSVFVRNQNPLPSGSGRGKNHYLNKTKQFALPFIKSVSTCCQYRQCTRSRRSEPL